MQGGGSLSKHNGQRKTTDMETPEGSSWRTLPVPVVRCSAHSDSPL
jgi:hypothetical protein